MVERGGSIPRDPVPGREPGEAGRPSRDTARQLLERAALGDREAFARLYDEHAPAVVRLCRRILESADEAEDARSEVFLRAQRAFAGYDRERPLRAWLLGIASNHCVDRLRRRRVEGRLFEPGELDGADLPASGPDPLRAALLQERRRELLAALDALPARYRAALVLRYFAELPYAEMAGTLGIGPEHVGVVLFRAKVRLREVMAGKGDRP